MWVAKIYKVFKVDFQNVRNFKNFINFKKLYKLKNFKMNIKQIFYIGLLFLSFQIQAQKQNDKLARIQKENGDNELGTSMIPVMNDAYPVLKYIEDSLKAEVVRVEYDLLFDSKDSFRPFFKGWNYGVCVVGDYRINKIKLRLFRQEKDEWILVKENDENGNIALSMVTAESDGMYRFEITAKGFVDGFTAGHYALIIFH